MTPQHPSIERIIDYIHHELAPSEDAVLFAHFAECPACRDEYEAELRLTATLRSAAAAQTFELPPMVKAEIWKSVRSRESRGWNAWLRPLIALPVAAAIAVAALFAVQQANGPMSSHPGVGAQYYFASHNAATRQENPLTDRSAPALNVIEASDVTSQPSPLIEAAGAASGDEPAR